MSTPCKLLRRAPAVRRRSGASAPRWLLATVALVWASLRTADAALECKLDAGVCYRGTNLPVTFPGSQVQGCQELPDPEACCSLCATYWPTCQSWQYIQVGDGNGYDGMNNYCCLKTTFRPDPFDGAFCNSGYQSPGCFISADCEVEVHGPGVGATDRVVILPENQECGHGIAKHWDGIINPQVVTNDGVFKSYAMGKTPTGDLGEYRLCYRQGPGELSTYNTIVGGFRMKGPYPEQQKSCYLAAPCNVEVDGLDLPSNPAAYKLAIMRDSEFPCGENSTLERLAIFNGLENPRNVDDDANDNLFRLGTTIAGDTLTDYAMCWAVGPNVLTEYTHHIGTFRLMGPHNQQYECTKGRVCQLTLAGRGFESTNKIVIINGNVGDLCGQFFSFPAYFGFFFANPSDNGDTLFDTYNFGESTDGMPSENYRICWGRAPDHWVMEMYPADAGAFRFRGPASVPQECWVTVPCILTLPGTKLLANDGVLLANGPCGETSPAYIDASGETWANPRFLDGNQVATFGTATAGTVSNIYRLCWGALPTVPAEYNIQVGLFTLNGPTVPAVPYKCIKGINCFVILEGFGFAATNRIIIGTDASECGNETPALADFSPMVVSKLANQDGLYKEYEFGFPDLGTARSGYALCWSHAPSSFTDYTFVASAFVLVGPLHGDKTCILGLDCTITLEGEELAVTNRIILLKVGSCGDNIPTYASFGGMVASKGAEATDPGIYKMGLPISGPPSTAYVLCWANAPGVAGGAALYRSTVGYMTMRGPVQVGHACIMTMTCVITLSGVGLSTTNRLLIIPKTSECGVAPAVVAVMVGVTNPSAPDADSVTYRVGTLGSGLPGAASRLCWAHAPSASGDELLFRTTLGDFTIGGPYVLPDIVDCTLGLNCIITLTGFELASTNRIMIVSMDDVCGRVPMKLLQMVGSPNPILTDQTELGRYDLLVPTSMAAPGEYQVCWSHSGADQSDFDVRVATLRMAGPFMKPVVCKLSEPCLVELRGVRFSHLSKVLVIEGPSKCGDADATVPSWGGMHNPASTALIAAPVNPGYVYADGDTYDAGLPISGPPGARYFICWAFDPAGAGGTAEYKVPIGTFEMYGPDQGIDVRCVLGLQCNFQVTGWGLLASNLVEIVSGDGECGSAGMVRATLEGITNPKAVTDDAYDSNYAMGLVTIGGSYSECRTLAPPASCIGSHYKLCWAAGTDPANPTFLVHVGKFGISGPFVTYKVACTLGAVCAFRIYGTSLALSNRLLVIDSASKCGLNSPIVASIPGLSNPQRASEVSADGTEATFRLGLPTGGTAASLRLCWGYDPQTLKEYNIEVGPFVFSPPSELCSVKDGLTLECSFQSDS